MIAKNIYGTDITYDGSQQDLLSKIELVKSSLSLGSSGLNTTQVNSLISAAITAELQLGTGDIDTVIVSRVAQRVGILYQAIDLVRSGPEYHFLEILNPDSSQTLEVSITDTGTDHIYHNNDVLITIDDEVQRDNEVKISLPNGAPDGNTGSFYYIKVVTNAQITDFKIVDSIGNTPLSIVLLANTITEIVLSYLEKDSYNNTIYKLLNFKSS